MREEKMKAIFIDKNGTETIRQINRVSQEVVTHDMPENPKPEEKVKVTKWQFENYRFPENLPVYREKS